MKHSRRTETFSSWEMKTNQSTTSVGADLRNILDFEKDFPNTTIIKLEQNYRSTSAILEAAGALISKNRERKGKRLIPRLDEGRQSL